MRRRRCTYRSSFEDKVLAKLRDDGKDFKYESMKLKYVISANYTPDIVLANGIIVELKGYFDADDRRKMKLIKEQYPDLDIRLVFQKANKTITKSSKRATKKIVTPRDILSLGIQNGIAKRPGLISSNIKEK